MVASSYFENDQGGWQHLSIADLKDLTRALPPSIRDDVIDYARSVQKARLAIFRDAFIPFDDQLANDLVFVAGIKRIYDLISSTYWLANNSLAATGRSGDPTERVIVGGLHLDRSSGFYQRLTTLLRDMETILRELGIRDLVQERNYASILRQLADRH